MRKEYLFFLTFLLTFSLTVAQTSVAVGEGTPVLDGKISTGEWNNTEITTNLGVKINAMADGQYLYVVAQWADTTESVAKHRWTYDGTSWSQSGNEDRIGFMWDMGQNGTDGANCTTMCHGDGLMHTNSGIADQWHWKAARSNAIGYIDDKYIDATNMHGDAGVSSYSDNADDGNGFPSFMANGDAGINAEYLLKDAAAVAGFNPFATINTVGKLAVPFDANAGWKAGDHVPGYVLRVPEGDRASVEAAGNYANGMWTVEFRKPYAGTAGDFEVVKGSSVNFTYEIFDNQGGTHPNDGFDASIYTLDFSNIPGTRTNLVVENGEAVLDGVVSPGEYTSSTLETAGGVKLNAVADGQYLYVVAQWADSTENVAKHRWTYDGSVWSKTGNEDRIGFMWDMGTNGTDGANCTTMCHGDGLMHTNGGTVDQWHWKAARSNGMGVVDDKWVDASNQNGDPGVSAYSDNAADANGLPSFMAAGDPNSNVEFLTTDAASLNAFNPYGTLTGTADIATAFDANAAWTVGSHVPGYVLRIAEGDRASVKAAGKYENGMWTVEFRKPFAGTDYDFTVTPGGKVNFTLETFDNQGGTHPNDGFDATLYTLDFSNLVAGKSSLVVAPGDAVLDGVIDANEYASSVLETKLGVKFQAVADGQYLYLAAQWADSTESVAKHRWTYDGSSWSKTGNEDRIGFMWDMGTNGTDGANCTTMCHGDGLMHTNGGTVDQWHWKAARTNPMGYADDKWVDATNQNGDPGVSTYSDNADNGNGLPSFIGANDPGANSEYLVNSQEAFDAFNPFGTVANSVDIARDMDASTFNTDDHVSGYILRVPDGDRASVQAAGKYANGMWTVEFKKPYSGSQYDFSIETGKKVDFTYEIFDNQGGTHPNDGFDATLYTLDFSLVTGIEDNEDTQAPKSFNLSQNYPNPFNPTTKIAFSISNKAHVTLNVYNAIGQQVANLVNQEMNAGSFEVNFDASQLSSGIYFYRLVSGNNVMTKKMILLK